MTKINLEDLSNLRSDLKDKRIVFCSGTFDLTHVGHVLFFEDCKKYGDYLVVAVAEDNAIRKLKGKNRPILNEHIRLKTVDSYKPVNYVLLNGITDEDHNSEIREIMNRLNPDAYIINKDTFDIPGRRKMCAEQDVELVILDRYCPKEYEDISTTKIIEKIKSLDL